MEKNAPPEKWTKMPSICSNIQSVDVRGDVVSVYYNEEIPTTNESLLSLHFALATKWLGRPIFFSLGSGEVVDSDSNSVSLKFHLPVVDSYDGLLLCAATGEGPPKTYHELKTHILRKLPVKLSLSDFSDNLEYSQLKCHHKNEFARRWCEARNLAYFDHHFFFFSPAVFEFPEPFLVPGPRAPPFDKAIDRFVIEPIVIPYSVSTVPRQLELVTDFCYIYGVFHNYYMLWHTIFDFMIPLYNFIRLFNGKDTPANRRIYVRSDGVWAFHSMMNIFSKYPVMIIDSINPSIVMREAVIGIEKLELDTNPDRTYDDSISFHYDFNRSTALGMREDILNVLNIPTTEVGDGGRPLALLIDRGTGSRNIQNTQEIASVMKSGCPHCQVTVVEFHKMEVEEQMQLTSRASVLVGLHGSGLAHTIWMQESRPSHPTYLVEIMPYKYTCRNWYETAAHVAGVNYRQVMNRKEPTGTVSPHLRYCWSRPSICATIGCHDMLRDQPTLLEIDTFNNTWMEIAEALKKTETTMSK